MKTYEEILEHFIGKAAEAGLELNYSPEVLCEDIAQLTTEEWVELRHSGIGGSDAGTVMKVNSHRTVTELYKDKKGLLPKKTVSPKQQYIFDYGHQMEAALGKYFEAVTGFKVETERRMFRHPLYPFMTANLDGLFTNGEETGILEFKTANPDMKYFYRSGTLGEDAKLGNPAYEYQVRQYMAVMNLFAAYICVGFSNNADDIVIIRVERDIDKEVSLINAEYDFWNNNVLKGICPYQTTYSDESYKALQPDAKSNPIEEPLRLPESFRSDLKELVELNRKKTQLNAQIKKIEERCNALKLPIEEELNGSSEAFLLDEEGEYKVTYRPLSRTSVSAENLKKMKLSEPEIYDRYASTTESRSLKVSFKEPKGK